MERFDFLFGEQAPFTWSQVAELQGAERLAMQPHNVVPNCLEHTLDLMVTPFVNRDTHLLPPFAHKGDLCRLCRAVIERNPRAQLLCSASCERGLELRKIRLGHMVTRMKERISQLTIGREQEKPRGVGI